LKSAFIVNSCQPPLPLIVLKGKDARVIKQEWILKHASDFHNKNINACKVTFTGISFKK